MSRRGAGSSTTPASTQTVENDGTFYRLPARETFAGWQSRTPEDFVMAIKASRYLTHIRRLRDPAEPVSRLMSSAAGLGRRLGPVLLQLPPNLAADPPRLDACLAEFAKAGGEAPVRVAVEPRHPSWWTERDPRPACRPRRRPVLGRPARASGDAAMADGRVGLPQVSRGRGAAVATLRHQRAAVLAGPDPGGMAGTGAGLRLLQQRSVRRSDRRLGRVRQACGTRWARGHQDARSAPAWLRPARPVSTPRRNVFAIGPALLAPKPPPSTITAKARLPRYPMNQPCDLSF